MANFDEPRNSSQMESNHVENFPALCYICPIKDGSERIVVCAQWFCTTCSKNLCSDCSFSHALQSMSHTIIPLPNEITAGQEDVNGKILSL